MTILCVLYSGSLVMQTTFVPSNFPLLHAVAGCMYTVELKNRKSLSLCTAIMWRMIK